MSWNYYSARSKLMNSINSFLLKLCKNPFIRSLIATSPRWHCSANAGRRTPPLLLCKHHKLRATTEAALLSASLSLSHACACSLSLTPSSNTCLLSFVWLSFPSLHPKATKRFLLASAFSLTSNYPFVSCQMRRQMMGWKKKKEILPFRLSTAFPGRHGAQCYQPL